ncbi:hypothetical protein [Teredinibacter turnerae]|uniref:hypothetical protein n=1 Tax=Teredinibacter turnerae TaxID=2426 RepID=UPI00048DE949|nr:hypothetical protein [Teredinibacter turnerae]
MSNRCLPSVSRGVISFAIVVLTACGGGGSDSSGGGPTAPTSVPTVVPSATPSQPPVVEDKTPAEFSFTAISGVEPAAVVESESVEISGINVSVDVTIQGGEFSIEGAAYTSSPATITTGKRLKLRATAGAFGETVEVKITVGDTEKTFHIVTRAPDLEPESFTFGELTDADPNTDQVSNAVTIQGIEAAAVISITGGAYSINDSDFVSSAGTIKNGDKLVLRLTTSTQFESNTTASVSVGGYSTPFSVKTRAPRTQPDAFSFIESIFASMGAWKTSPPAVMHGLEVSTGITVTNGRYRIGSSADFTDQPGTIGPGDTVYVQVLAADLPDTAATVTVNIGGVEAQFTATTAPDWDAPTGEILFPPRVSLTNSLLNPVRVRVADDFGISQVKLFVVDQLGRSDTQFMWPNEERTEWTSQLRLAETTATVVLQVKDASGNWEYEADEIVITRASDQETGFPSTETVSLPDNCCLFAIDAKRNRFILGDSRSMVAVDITDGSRTQLPTPPEATSSYQGDTFIDDGDTLILLDRDGKKIYRYSLKNPQDAEISVIASSDDGKDISVGWPNAVTANADGSLLYVGDSLSRSIYSVHPVTGDRKLISDNTIVSDVDFAANIYDIIAVDSDRLLVLQASDNESLIWVDIKTGKRTLNSQSATRGIKSALIRDMNFDPATQTIHMLGTVAPDSFYPITISVDESSYERISPANDSSSPANGYAEYDFDNGFVYFTGGSDNITNIRVLDPVSLQTMFLSNDVK